MVLAGGQVVNRIGRFDSTNWDNMGGGLNGTPSAIVEFNGQIYVGGSFTSAGGMTVKNVAMWDGVNWNALGGGLNNTVNALVVYNGQLYAGGSFTGSGNGVTLFQVAVWDGVDWQYVPGVDAGLTTSSVNALATDGTYLYAGGSYTFFRNFDSTITNIAYFDGGSWYPMGASLGPSVVSLAFFSPSA